MEFLVLCLLFLLRSAPVLSQNSPPPWCGSICEIPQYVHVPGPALPTDYRGCFSNLMVFGNSLEDTGNLATLLPPAAPNAPYGITWPGCPKGRFSDGHLVADYYAEALKVIYPRPYSGCPCGTDFAIAGATVLSVAEYAAMNLTTIVPYTLGNQLEWYAQYRNSCKCFDPRELFRIHIGGIDYTVAALGGWTPTRIIRTLVRRVVRRFVQAVQYLIDSGATNILVDTVPQLSCTPLFKTLFESVDDIQNGCLVEYGRIVAMHNELLVQQLFSTLSIPKGVVVAIEDRYAEFFEVWNNPSRFGIYNREVACCGGGGRYNFNSSADCGTPAATACPYPLHAFYWDSVHFTDRFDRIAAAMFLSGKYVYAPGLAGKQVFRAMCKK